MRKIQDLGRRAAALALAAGMTLSVVPGVLAVDADEVLTPPAQTAEQEPETGEPEEPAEEPADSEEEKPAASDAEGGGTELPADSETRRPVVVDPDQLPADSGTETPADSDKEQPMDPDKEEPAGSDAEQPADSKTEQPASSDTTGEMPSGDHDDEIDTYTKYHMGDCDFSQLVEDVPASATADGYKKYRCTKTYGIIIKHQCDETTTVTVHYWGDWEGTDATCEAAAVRYRVCQNCGKVEHDTEYEKAHGALGHTKGTEIVEKRVEPTCSEEGSATYVCSVCEKEFTEPLEKLPHTWSEEYKDDDKPGCQEQTESQYCTVCGARNPEYRHLSDAVRKNHKFTHYEVTGSFKLAGKTVITELTAYCDYGCGEKDVIKTEGIGSAAEIGEVKALEAAADSVADTVTKKVNEALKKTEEEVRNAETKEDAVKALDTIYNETLAAITGIKVGSSSVIDEPTAAKLLAGLRSTLDTVQDSLNSSFLSKDTVQDTVSTIVTAATGEAGAAATKKSAYELIFTQARGAINTDDGADTDPILNDLILKMAQAAVDEDDPASKAALDAMVDSLVNDALDEVIQQLKENDKYGKLLQTKFGDDVLGDVDQAVKDRLLNDPEFMQQVRSIVQNAAVNANTGVNSGWSNDKILSNLYKDLQPINGLISDTITNLGSDAGDIVDNKVDDTVHKFLPGRLGDWVSDKIGDFAKDLVNKETNKLNSSIAGSVSSYLKYFTCGSKHKCDQYKVTKNPTCTEEGEYTYECQYCGWTSGGGKIPAAGHTMVEDPAVEPTETSTGRTAGSHCSTCGYVETAQQEIPMLDPSIDPVLNRTATTVEDARAAGFDSVERVNAALDAALVQAGFDPAHSEHFTVQVGSSIGILPNDRFPAGGVTGTLTLPAGTRGKAAQNYYAVQMFTADNAGHKAGDVVVTPIRLLQNGQNGMELTVYSEAVLAIAWKAQ